MSYQYGFRPYVSVAKRRARARKKMDALRKKGVDVRPVQAFRTRGIARTFWGKAWCDHLEKFSDYANRLPRGRTYVRNGSVVHLEVARGEVRAMVMGNALYNVTVKIGELPAGKWKAVRKRCAGQVGSLIELLQGKLSESAMAVVTDRNQGLFPRPGEIRLHCDCPDWATMCKHVAAVLYGVGARLDERPELLFRLRGVDHEELISSEAGAVKAATGGKKKGRRRIAEGDLADVFGIDVAGEDEKKKKKKKKKPPPKRAPEVSRGRRKSAAGASGKPVTGRTVASLRRKFGMTQTQLARLLGTSAATVGNWERKAGPLRMQARTGAAWSRVARLGKREAWRRLSEDR